MAVEDKAALLSRLQQHDAFFCGMVNLVPAELYLRKEDDEGKDANAKYFKVRLREKEENEERK